MDDKKFTIQDGFKYLSKAVEDVLGVLKIDGKCISSLESDLNKLEHRISELERKLKLVNDWRRDIDKDKARGK